ncbi:MAG: citrate lyase subunit beta/citryl-CoA lyase [Granulosicoccus sp.]|jgi:citrate lyase subunit beta/citryl-CoA lyase
MSKTDQRASTLDCRSALYMPASNKRALQKGPSLCADAIILDLEDSVGPEQKAQARRQAITAFSENDYGYRIRALRINAADTQWHGDDILAAIDASPDVIVLPKVETPRDVLQVREQLSQHSGLEGVEIWAMMESPRAILNAQKIASCSDSGLSALLIGNNDMARASNMPVTSDRTYLVPWLMQLVAVAHANSLALLDGVYNHFSDLSGFQSECEQGVSMGMTGKTLIHPSQLPITNEVFSPAEIDIHEAQAVVHAFAQPENVAAGVLQINGRMIERLHLDMAMQLIERVERLRHR